MRSQEGCSARTGIAAPCGSSGVTMAGLEKPHGVEQPSIFEHERRARSLTRQIDHLRDLYGERAVLRAAALR